MNVMIRWARRGAIARDVKKSVRMPILGMNYLMSREILVKIWTVQGRYFNSDQKSDIIKRMCCENWCNLLKNWYGSAKENITCWIALRLIFFLKKNTGATNTGSSIWVPVLVPNVPM
jgi:ABC-type uncharacterized transport system YnjBCD permease subunit